MGALSVLQRASTLSDLSLYSRRALALLWETNPPLTLMLAALTIVGGIAPAAIAYAASHIVDAVVLALSSSAGEHQAAASRALRWIVIEGTLVAAAAAAQRGLTLCQALLRAQLTQRVTEMIFAKSLTMELAQFENSAHYDKLSRAHTGASTRPLSLIVRTFGMLQQLLSLASCALLLMAFSPWAVGALVLAGMPLFFSEAIFSTEAFRHFLRRSPETRMQTYLSTLLSREDYAKEIKLFGLGPVFVERHRRIFDRLYRETRSLTMRRDLWGFALGGMSTLTLYGAYALAALAALAARITVGQMTMYVMLFRQGQAAVSAMLTSLSGMYEDQLYLSALYEFLETPTPARTGTAERGPHPTDGIRFEHVSFSYPGSALKVLHDIDLHIRPGESLALVGENGSGKTTLAKLLAGLYAPVRGRITLDGQDLRDWDESALHARMSVIFQDYTRYQFSLGENIGVGDAVHLQDEERWRRAAEKGMVDTFLSSLPQAYATQLGKWFKNGCELSGGQWQKVALARAFMRDTADILVLDEPTAAMDPDAEARLFERFRALTGGRIAILISHRFSTVRMADRIVVLQHGRILEHGTHAQLMQNSGHYCRLFTLQAAGYR